VQTPYGKGQILEIRTTGIVVVSPTNWLLANGKPPVFYLNGNDGSLVSLIEPSATPTPAPVTEESTVMPRIRRAIELKDQGTEFFQKNDYESAASSYGQALTVMNVQYRLLLFTPPSFFCGCSCSTVSRDRSHK
jgi:hypothetical protein